MDVPIEKILKDAQDITGNTFYKRIFTEIQARYAQALKDAGHRTQDTDGQLRITQGKAEAYLDCTNLPRLLLRQLEKQRDNQG